jgi:hypothetical protein
MGKKADITQKTKTSKIKTNVSKQIEEFDTISEAEDFVRYHVDVTFRNLAE